METKPETGYSRDKSLGRKVLDVGKNFWKILPFVAMEHYDKKQKNLPAEEKDDFSTLKFTLHTMYNIAATFVVLYSINGITNGALNPPFKQNNEKKIEAQYQEALWENQNPFKDCKTKEDSINALYLLGREDKIGIAPFSKEDKNRILEGLVD